MHSQRVGVSPIARPSGGGACPLHSADLLLCSHAEAEADARRSPTVPANEAFANLTKPEGAAVTAGAAAAAAGGTLSGTAGIRTSSIRMRGGCWRCLEPRERGGGELEAQTQVVVCQGEDALGRLGGCRQRVHVVPNAVKPPIRQITRTTLPCTAASAHAVQPILAPPRAATQSVQQLRSLASRGGADRPCHERPCLCSRCCGPLQPPLLSFC